MKLLHKRGFLLFEFIITLLLLITFSAGLFVSYRWTSYFGVRTELNAFMIFLRYIQQRAIVEGKDRIVVLDIDRHSYCIKNEKEKSEYFFLNDTKFVVLSGVKGPPSSPNLAPGKPVTFIDHEIVFYKTGIISSGIVYIADVKNHNQYAISNAVASYSTLRLYRYTKDEKWVLL
jgi:hypothetical protein